MKRLLADVRGVALLELALTAPMIALAAIGAYDIMNGYAMKLDLEQAAQRVTDLALVQKPVGDDTHQIAYLKTEAAAALGDITAPTTVDVYLTCNGVRQSDFDAVCSSGALYARYVAVTITGNYQPLFGYAGFLGGGSVDGVSVVGNSSVRIQ